MATKQESFQATIKRDELPVHPWRRDQPAPGVRATPLGAMSLAAYASKVVRQFSKNPTVQIAVSEERADQWFLRFTPYEGPLAGANIFAWLVFDAATDHQQKLWPELQANFGCLTPTGIFQSIGAKEQARLDGEPTATHVKLSTGGVSVCLPGYVGRAGSHPNDYAIARTGAPKPGQAFQFVDIHIQGHVVSTINKNGKHATTAAHGGDITFIIKHLAACLLCGRDGFDVPEGAEKWGFTKQEASTDAAVRKLVDDSDTWNQHFLPKVLELFHGLPVPPAPPPLPQPLAAPPPTPPEQQAEVCVKVETKAEVKTEVQTVVKMEAATSSQRGAGEQASPPMLFAQAASNTVEEEAKPDDLCDSHDSGRPKRLRRSQFAGTFKHGDRVTANFTTDGKPKQISGTILGPAHAWGTATQRRAREVCCAVRRRRYARGELAPSEEGRLAVRLAD